MVVFDAFQPKKAPAHGAALYFAAVPVDSKLAETDTDGKPVAIEKATSAEPSSETSLTRDIKFGIAVDRHHLGRVVVCEST